MNRRDTILALAALGATPLATVAQQQGKVWRIGYLHLRSGPSERDDAFFKALRELGYVDGRNLVVEYRWSAGRSGKMQDLALELVERKVDVIVTSSTVATEAAKRATKAIPIVMAAVSDPVGTRLIESLARPGTNVTGLSQMVVELAGKRLELLREMMPNVARLAVFASGTSPADTQRRLERIRASAERMGIELLVLHQKGTEDWPNAFDTMRRERAQAVYVQTGPGTIDNKKLLIELLLRQRLPAIFEVGEFADAGGLMSYGYNVVDMYRRAAGYLDKIFKGARPIDLPVEEPTNFELVINLRTAKALGMKAPSALLLRANRVIE